MRYAQFRYTVKKPNGHIFSETFPLHDIERGYVSTWLKNNSVGVTSQIEKDLYTGLKDKNGKEIYEGDILIVFNSDNQIQKKELICIVEWSEFGAFQATVNIVHLWEKYHVDPPEKGKPLYFLNLATNGNYEITGNIHENPELIS